MAQRQTRSGSPYDEEPASLGDYVHTARAYYGMAKRAGETISNIDAAIDEQKRLAAEEAAAQGTGTGARNPLTPEQIQNAEAAGSEPATKPLSTPRALYRAGKQTAKDGIRGRIKEQIRKRRKGIILTLAFNLIIGVFLLLLSFISPLKNIHFETVLQGSNFAAFQLVLYKQFARASFNAAVLSKKSVGTWTRSPLVRQLQLATPNYQIKQLGRSDRVKWEFNDNGGFGQAFLPFQESLKAVVIDGDTIDIDEMSKELFGSEGKQKYSDLTLREKFTVQARFTEAVHLKLGNVSGFLPRYVRWNPTYQLRRITGAQLIRWLNKAREYAGKKPDEAKKLSAQEEFDRVSPDSQHKTPKSSDLGDLAEGEREEAKAAFAEGRMAQESPKKRNLINVTKGLGAASLVDFAWTTSCLVKDLSDYVADADLQRQAQAIRYAVTGLASKDQQEVGDTVGEAVGAQNGEWDSVAGGQISDASKSVIYLMALGYSVNPTDEQYIAQTALMPTLTAAGMIGKAAGVVSTILSIVPGCSIVLNPITQWSVTGVEAIAAIVSVGTAESVAQGIKAAIQLGFDAAKGYGTGELTAWLINMIVRYYANTDFLTERGIDKVAAENVALKSLAQNANRTVTYGAPLSHAEALDLDRTAMAELRNQSQQSSFTNRYFAITNPFSLIGQVIARMPSSAGGVAGAVQNGASMLGSLLSSAPLHVFGALGNIFVAHTRAADTTNPDPGDAGVKEWGWSKADQRKIETDPSFALPNLLQRVEPNISAYEQRYGMCYDPNNALQVQIPDECYDGRLNEPDALYYRYYKAMLFDATQLTGSV